MTVAGVVLGLSVQTAGGSDYPAKKDRPPTKDYVTDVMKETLPPAGRQVIRVSTDKPEASSRKEPLYRPPQRGAPGGRVGGGTRGPSATLPLLWALVPDHVGLSTELQPRLVWYLSKVTTYPLEFTIIDETGVTTLLEKPLSSPTQPGIQIIRLTDYDLKLEKGKTYQWFVSLVSDSEYRSTDIVTGGMIQVGDVPASLGENVKDANPVEAAKLWAQAGFWYDAMGLISSSIQANPSNAQMHDLRASLLEEVNLDTPAQGDRGNGL
jgi:hypothetical protein